MTPARKRWIRLRQWARRVELLRKLLFILTLAVIPSAVATMLAMSPWGGEGGAPDPTLVITLLSVDVLLLLALGVVVGWRVASIFRAQKRGSRGSGLHWRFIRLFAVVAIVPTVLVSVGFIIFFRYGVESWFSERVSTAVHASLQIAKAYLDEHRQMIGGDVLAMANDINRDGVFLSRSPQQFNSFIASQTAFRGLSEATIFDSRGRILARSGLLFSVEAGLADIPHWAYERAREGEVAIITTEDDRIRALVRLQGFIDDTYLYVGRFVDPSVLSYVEHTAEAVREYERLEGSRSELEWAFSMIFAVVALLLLLAAVRVGFSMAMQLSTPIAKLIDAADAVGRGDFAARVEENSSDEIGDLSRSFNRMTGELSQQRRDLVRTNRELDERRRFTETVLEGVTSGIIGLDQAGRIDLINRSAAELLGLNAETVQGRTLHDIVPDFIPPLMEIAENPDRMAHSEIRLVRDGHTLILLVHIAAEYLDDEVIGYVLTFDDISPLLAAQRKAAWADVARRIAHEIKNPLTPIQLSAERLKRKYLKEIQTDPETYSTLIETIIRQVGDIGRMVDAFSSFAKMPTPQMKKENLVELCRNAVFLQRQGAPEITFETDLPTDPVAFTCDSRMIGQAITNILKNAVEAIHGREGENPPPGVVSLRLDLQPHQIQVRVDDNGRGLPKVDRDRLTEPYVTTRAKGTGLGLAIVKKIVEDHGGNLSMDDSPSGGASICLTFPMEGVASEHTPATTDRPAS